jgi:NAD(P)-dependent dehydrogenase (short-subunit alcohol dehydrogenase family)
MNDSILPMFSVAGRKAMVTGAALGIGRACATALAIGGADVAIVDHDEKAGRRTAEAIRSEHGVDTVFIRCDVSDHDQVRAAVAETVGAFGRLDIGVNSAGVVSDTHGIEQDPASWEKTLGIDLSGVWFCAQAQALQMRRQEPGGGKIVNIASAAARNASSDGAYCASKAGVVQLTRSMAMQLGAVNINVNSISPGVVMTRALTRAIAAPGMADLRRITPLGHIGRPRDLWGAVLFLTSAASDFVTGHDLVIDGGRTLSTWAPVDRELAPRVSESDEVVDLDVDLEVLAQG